MWPVMPQQYPPQPQPPHFQQQHQQQQQQQQAENQQNVFASAQPAKRRLVRHSDPLPSHTTPQFHQRKVSNFDLKSNEEMGVNRKVKFVLFLFFLLHPLPKSTIPYIL
eukprot:TRINITY_DN1462_c1_g1_i3.p1 TRINITY_DN1462_c1_g1~~TRINITY_DN1462_c1_g1_i3.p1  ORF type:complete len:108 (+),score=39.71 TRINITY_DN1462_c1_g1_i3:72-395(+)